jgi:branched-chain amino acid transport system substrate-binding protein
MGGIMSKHRGNLLDRPVSRRTFGIGAGAALAAVVTPFNIVRAQGGPLKVGMLLPKSGFEAQIGQSCQRGVELAQTMLKELGYTVELQIMNADTESNVDVARSRAEKLISDGAHVLIGAFDSGQTSAIAQVTEQRGVPFVINIGSQPQITESGYKWVVRNFPRTDQLIARGLERVKSLLEATHGAPKTAAYLHVNDTFGMAVSGAINKLVPTMNLPFKIVEEIAYDPSAKDLSVEISKAKATGADLALVTTRINDAILLVREMVKQRWSPMGIVSPGSPGMYEQGFFSALGKYSEYCTSMVPWVNPKATMTHQITAQFKKKYPNDPVDPHIFNVSFTFEAFLVAADAYARAKTTSPAEYMSALRKTKIEHHIMVGGPIEFDEKGQNNGIVSVGLQNRGGRAVVVLPKEAAELAPVFPMPGLNDRA